MTLRLNLVHTRPGPSRWGWVLLAVGLSASAWSSWCYHAETRVLDQARLALEHGMPKPVRTAGPPHSALQAGKSPMVTNAQKALKADWQGLLSGLERGRPRQIALLSLEADPVRGIVTLNANAKDLPALLAYLGSLESAGLGYPRLESHAAMSGEGASFIQFRAQAKWGTEP